MVDIKLVRTYTKGQGEAAKKMVCINNEIHLSQKQLDGLGYSVPHALIGGKIEAEYYAEGEKLLNGDKCTKADTIVKDFQIEDNEKLNNMRLMAAAGLKVSLT